jgi:hypothetical protein
MLRTIIIDPKERTIEEAEIDEGLSAIYEQINCDTFCMVRIAPTNWLYLDDMGRYREEQHYFVMPELYGDVLTNRAIILGDGVSTSLSLDYVKEQTLFAKEMKDGQN